jgi:hypothetical protein
MSRKTTTTLLSLFIVAVFLMSACASSATVNTTSEAAQTGTTSTTEVSSQPVSDSNTGPAAPPSGTGPGGPPPSGTGPGAPPPGAGTGGSNADEGLATATGAYTLDGGTATLSGETYTAKEEDQSGVYAINGAKLTLSDATIVTSGNTSSDENSSFYGLNAGVLAAGGSAIDLSNSSITTSGTGANGAFATGNGSSVKLTNITINATGDGGHGIMATQGGTATLTNVTFTTSGAHSAPVATDRGGGTITSTGDKITVSGTDSPCYYSTGSLTITDAVCNSTNSESVVIEGANSVILNNSSLTSSIEDKWGVMIYQSFSGDAQGSNGIFTMTGGSLAHTASEGPLFYVTNTTGNITLKNVDVKAASGTLIQAAANDRWGQSGSNGGTAVLTADGQSLIGDIIADDISAVTAVLQNGSSLAGSVNADGSSAKIDLTLDSTSVWNVTADSHITCLVDTDGISGTTVSNIIGNGHTVYYDSAACAKLGGQIFTLSGGGTLQPEN